MITMPNNDVDLSRFALPQAKAELKRNQLGQEQFLQLMLTQLQNQDPLQPMEDGEFISQMAQFSTVEEIGGMSRSLETLAESLTASMALQASTMVGRSVLVDGDTGTLGEETPLKAGVELHAPLNNAFVRIFDASGQLVREMPLGPRNQGVATFEWDGVMTDGDRAAPGTYFVRAGFLNGDTEESLPTYIASKVASITLNGDGSGADVTTADGQRVSLSKIKAIM
jgi:flagellar basal-body rod modification protein FlgD